MITSSILTLVVVPVVCCYMDDLARWGKRFAARCARYRSVECSTIAQIYPMEYMK